eukprot:6189197-Pleurochrysis_carterae.AAC.4
MPDGSMIARKLPQSSMVQVPDKNMCISTEPKQWRDELLRLLGNCILYKQRTVPRAYIIVARCDHQRGLRCLDSAGAARRTRPRLPASLVHTLHSHLE